MQNQPSLIKRVLTWFGAAVVLLAVIAGAYVYWTLQDQIAKTEALLESARDQVVESERRMRTVREEADQAERSAVSMADEKARVEQAKAEAELARLEEEAARLRAEIEARQAGQRAEAARAQAEQAAEELEDIKRRRTEELDRMQAALARIVDTRRTDTGMVINLAGQTFQFAFDSAELTPRNRELLSRIAGVLIVSSGYRLQIYGHTDDVGTADYNQSLSDRRARSVRDYLVSAGVPEDIVSVKGFGKSSPLVEARTDDARSKNRRVEIGIVDTVIRYEGTTQ